MSYSTTTETVTATTVVVPEYLADIAASVTTFSERAIHLLGKIPGGEILIRYIRYSYQDDPYRSVFELLLLIFAITYFLTSKSSYDKKDYVKLTEREIDELVADWQPEPLVLPVQEEEKWQLDAIPVITGESKAHTKLLRPATGEVKEVINLASLNFLDLTSNEELKDAAIGVISHTGVGACGPPNFYGTQDVHNRLEEDIASFLGTEKAILYAQDFVAAQSIIPCFLKRGDIAVVDGGVNLQIQKAVKISRCEVHWYDHNDMSSLESVVKNLNEELKGEELTRRFIITEALSQNYGDIPDLAKIVEIKKKYKYRLILDESRSIGVLGKGGKGLAEHFGVSRTEVDVTIGSLTQSFASSGGFCTGEIPMVNHQKIQSNGYVFSAALPPYCAKVGSVAISLIQRSTDTNGVSKLIATLQKNTRHFYAAIAKNRHISKYLEVISSPDSPTIHLKLSAKLRESLELPASYGGLNSEIMKAVAKGIEKNYLDHDYNLENYLLQTIIDRIIDNGVLITRSQRIPHHEILPMIPELLINVNAGLTTSEVDEACAIIGKEVNAVLSKITLKKFDNLL